MKYSEFPYKRITVESRRELMNDWLERFDGAMCAEDQVAVIMEVDVSCREYASYYAISYINFHRDTTDEAAKAEKEYYDSIEPEIREIYNRFDIALAQSPFKAELAFSQAPAQAIGRGQTENITFRIQINITAGIT